MLARIVKVPVPVAPTPNGFIVASLSTIVTYLRSELSVEVGDIVCMDPRTRVTEKGYIKSRFLDDKLSVGVLLGFAKYLKDQNITPVRRVYAHVTVYEEVPLQCSAFGDPSENRTPDTMIKSHVLYRLS